MTVKTTKKLHFGAVILSCSFSTFISL